MLEIHSMKGDIEKAIVLLSGGLDSATCLAFALASGFQCHALSFNYSQRHHAELKAACKIAKYFNVPHQIIHFPMDQIGGSALTDHAIHVPDYNGKKDIPTTYVPARNTIFLAIALGMAEVLHITDIFIGVSSIDYSGYPDCRPEYIKAFQTLANLATQIGVEDASIKIHTPLIYLSKAKTIQLGIRLGLNYQMTVSCYRANQEGYACGTCDSCMLRKKGFEEACVDDPTLYE